MSAALNLRSTALLAAASAAAVAAGGCLSPRQAAEDADAAAYDIIEQKQKAALGRVEPFTIERPEDLLRRRLMLDQQLPAAGAAGFGRAFLPEVPKEPEGVSPNAPLPAGAQVVSRPAVRVTGVNRFTLATDLFLNQIGLPPAAEQPAVRQPGVGIALGPAAPVAADVEPPTLVISLVDALLIGARNSRDYQQEKEDVYLTALDLDLERDRFEFRFAAGLDADLVSDQNDADGSDVFNAEDRTGLIVSPSIGIDKAFKSGAVLTSRIGVDVAQLLTGDTESSFGLLADASLTIPLLQGAGVEVVTEPLQQSERDAIYAIWDFERFKRVFAVNVTTRYYGVLQSLDSIANARGTYERLRLNSRRSRALFEAGQLPAVQVDQVVSNELRAYERVISAEQRFEQSLDEFKVFLGLPPDARVALDPAELERLRPLAERVLGPLAGQAFLDVGDAPATQAAPAGPGLPPEVLEEAIDPAAQPGPVEDGDAVQEPADPEEIDRQLNRPPRRTRPTRGRRATRWTRWTSRRPTAASTPSIAARRSAWRWATASTWPWRTGAWRTRSAGRSSPRTG